MWVPELNLRANGDTAALYGSAHLVAAAALLQLHADTAVLDAT